MLYIILIGIIIIVIAGVYYAKEQEKSKEILKEKYDSALRGSDKKAALDAGRAYYSSLREGKALTIYDEQAITNDLSAMK